VLSQVPCPDGFVAAVGAFAPDMAEIAAPVCRAVAASGRIVLDTPEAVGEAGDLLQAGIEVKGLSTLRGIVQGGAMARSGPVLFKNCGWAGWDLAAARLALSLAQ
jgi:ornithine cyclodeaminase